MCTLIVLREVFEDWPLVIAANRDEFYARPTRPPSWLTGQRPIFAGQDLSAGGTWLGVGPGGRFAALTNQPMTSTQAADRSRGHLVLGVLEQPDVSAAARWLEGEPMSEYHPFNLMFGHAGDIRLAYGRDILSWSTVPKGISVLTNGPLDSSDFPKIERIKARCAELRVGHEGRLDPLKTILADEWCPHPDEVADDRGDLWPAEVRARLHAVNVNTEVYGTRSSAIIAFQGDRVGRYLYCEAPIHVDGFEDLTPSMSDTESMQRGLSS